VEKKAQSSIFGFSLDEIKAAMVVMAIAAFADKQIILQGH